MESSATKNSVRHFRRAGRSLLAGAAVFLVVLAGCGEPAAMYQVPGAAGQVARGQTILVAPFMDTRTFVDDDDPHADDLGEHARTIFADALRRHPSGADAVVLTPEMPRRERSLANAEVAELGRLHGADVVVTGQVFSFTDTRAASIPARAGMFVRVVSAADGALLFVGDDYQAAAIPGAGGGRDLQARNVAERLVAGLLKDGGGAAADGVAARVPARSERALASLLDDTTDTGEDDEAGDDGAQPPPLPVIGSAPEGFYELPARGTETAAQAETAEAAAPAAESKTAESAGDGWTEMAALARLADAVLLETAADEFEAEADAAMAEAVTTAQTKAQPPTTPGSGTEDAGDVTNPADAMDAGLVVESGIESGMEIESDEAATSRILAESESLLDASFAARLTGDQLASDLFASGGNLWGDGALPDLPALPDFPATESEVLSGTAGEAAARESEPDGGTEVVVVEMEAETELAEARADGETEGEFDAESDSANVADSDVAAEFDAEADAADLALLPEPDGPLYSIPLVAEQPRAYRLTDAPAPAPISTSAPAEIAANPADATIDFDAEVSRARPAADSDAIRVLILPYHERENEHNLIERTGGGEVVTALYGTQLAADPGLQILWDATGQATHDALIDRGEAIRMGRMVGADYVVRGQVVEFRRSQSVPSFYSAVISTAVLAAQVFFAEFSGVDVATEVYRVSDGACVMSRRDRSQQKYVVQAEKTVRRLAAGMAESVGAAIRARDPELMTPLIDDLAPVTVLTNPR